MKKLHGKNFHENPTSHVYACMLCHGHTFCIKLICEKKHFEGKKPRAKAVKLEWDINFVSEHIYTYESCVSAPPS